jgi:hypothetical protein
MSIYKIKMDLQHMILQKNKLKNYYHNYRRYYTFVPLKYRFLIQYDAVKIFNIIYFYNINYSF